MLKAEYTEKGESEMLKAEHAEKGESEMLKAEHAEKGESEMLKAEYAEKGESDMLKAEHAEKREPVMIKAEYTEKEEPVMIKAEHAEKHLGDFYLQDISFELPKGYIMGLIGENGAGKTTLLNLILGLYRPDAGRITVFGKDYRTQERSIRNDTGYVLADEDLFLPDMKLEDNGHMFGRYYEHYDRELLLHYCHAFALDKDKRWKHISKGEKLKFQFAFALSHRAKLLVLDEPAANFDPEFQEQFLHILTEFVSSGECSIILATHQLNELERIADYLVFLHHGKLVFASEKETLMDKLRLVKGEEYKLKLLKKERVIYRESGQYCATALVRHRKADCYDRALEVSVPSVEEIMYYLIKSGRLE